MTYLLLNFLFLRSATLLFVMYFVFRLRLVTCSLPCVYFVFLIRSATLFFLVFMTRRTNELRNHRFFSAVMFLISRFFPGWYFKVCSGISFIFYFAQKNQHGCPNFRLLSEAMRFSLQRQENWSFSSSPTTLFFKFLLLFPCNICFPWLCTLLGHTDKTFAAILSLSSFLFPLV